jgi:hypothetical protein
MNDLLSKPIKNRVNKKLKTILLHKENQIDELFSSQTQKINI